MPAGRRDAPLNRRIELIGRIFGKLKILSPGPVEGTIRRTFWLCQCACGNQCNVRESTILDQSRLSCGCLMGQHIKQPDGTLKLLRDNWAKATVWRLYQYKHSAKTRGHSFTLSDEEFYSLIKQDCFYCGKEPSNIAQVPSRDHGSRRSEAFIYNGIDRVDNNKGYEMDNVVPCCSDCNRAKRSLTQDSFLQMVKRIYNIHFTKQEATA